MKIKELKQKNEKELQEMLKESRHKLRDLRFKAASNQLKNVREIRKHRRLIARLLFVLRQTDSRSKGKARDKDKRTDK